LPPAARGKAHGAWRFAHSVNRVFALRPALCALRIAWTPVKHLQKLFIRKMNKQDFFPSGIQPGKAVTIAVPGLNMKPMAFLK
jgi:hypothetical protein